MPQESINIATEILENYIETQNLRKVPKRFDILTHIYGYESDHFTIEALYEHIIKQGCKISRATLYNTIELLQAAKLVVRHQFQLGISNSTLYERSLNKKTHHHYICTQCGLIKEFKDDGMLSTAIKTRKIARFKQTSYTLCIYGICSACAKKMIEEE